MKPLKKLSILAVVLLALRALAWLAYAQSGDGFEISWSSVDGGGGVSAVGDFTLGAAIGQPDAGRMSGENYVVQGGFWQCLTDAVNAAGISSEGMDVNLA